MYLNSAAVMDGLRRAGRDRCILCGRAPHALGVWTPTPEYSRRLGAPPGKTRLVAYCVCKRCVRRPEAGTLIEDKILADVGDDRRN